MRDRGLLEKVDRGLDRLASASVTELSSVAEVATRAARDHLSAHGAPDPSAHDGSPPCGVGEHRTPRARAEARVSAFAAASRGVWRYIEETRGRELESMTD